MRVCACVCVCVRVRIVFARLEAMSQVPKQKQHTQIQYKQNAVSLSLSRDCGLSCKRRTPSPSLQPRLRSIDTFGPIHHKTNCFWKTSFQNSTLGPIHHRDQKPRASPTMHAGQPSVQNSICQVTRLRLSSTPIIASIIAPPGFSALPRLLDHAHAEYPIPLNFVPPAVPCA